MTTITKGQQTIYIRDHDSLDSFSWAGGCSGLGPITAPVGDVEWRDLYDPAALFQNAPDVEVEGGPAEIGATLRVKKSVRSSLFEDWLRCRWDVDVRWQECGRRDDRTNWAGITRLCRAKFLEYASDGDEVVTTQGDDADMIVTSAVKAPWPLIHLWPLAATLVDVSTTEDFTSVAVCQHEQCADAIGLAEGCKLYIGTSGLYAAPQVLLSADDGETWQASSLTGWHGDVEDIDCLGDFVVVVSAYDGAVMWSDDGVTWANVSLGAVPWAVAIYDPGTIVVVGQGGRIWRSLDTARSFTLVDNGVATSQTLYHVVAVDSQVWWAVGDNNALVRSEDGAATWSSVDGPALQALVDVTAILALDENRILLGYADGELWYTENGSDWHRDESITGFAEITHFAECGCGRVVMVGYDASEDGLVYESIDAGAPGTWQAHTVPGGLGILAGVTCCGPNLFIAVGSGVYLTGTPGQILKLE